ncbi:hypothetical protein NDU88_010168 [Pleurodeles waltl]|uniref:Uncharacterized protein n=1 Tax=Pleurodeles waltl TaxID=8319 RepID=A0AAV7PUI2_PLEWA|nr:hypothetical protein NDU88_010168 [Pleurodeles waltl]
MLHRGCSCGVMLERGAILGQKSSGVVCVRDGYAGATLDPRGLQALLWDLVKTSWKIRPCQETYLTMKRRAVAYPGDALALVASDASKNRVADSGLVLLGLEGYARLPARELHYQLRKIHIVITTLEMDEIRSQVT